MMQTGIVLLAAGSAERYGHDKRLASIGKGLEAAPMLLATIRAVRASGMPFVVVLRSGDHLWQQELDGMDVDWIASPEAHLGMGHSLAAGVHATQHWDGWLIALADMPFIQPSTFQSVAEALSRHKIVRPVFTSRDTGQRLRGHPVGFNRSCACDLMQCRGDEGARQLLAANPDDVHELLCSDEGIIHDVDRPDDIRR